MKNSKTKKLKPREKKLVKAIVQGKSQAQAYQEAGYAVSTPNANAVNAHKKIKQPHIQHANNDALEAHGATPEWAVSQLMKVASQDDEMGAKRLATMNILELHGWNKTDKPSVQLQVKNAFFQGGRSLDQEGIIDVQTTDPTEQ